MSSRMVGTRGFQSTLPMRGATFATMDTQCHVIFQSTLPMRGATGLGLVPFPLLLAFQSTLPMRGATACKQASTEERGISIHTPHAGSDLNIERNKKSY